MALSAPFTYTVGASKAGQSDFTAVIEWYLLGLVDNEMEFDLSSLCMRLRNALQNFDARGRTRQTSENCQSTPVGHSSPRKQDRLPEHIINRNGAATEQSIIRVDASANTDNSRSSDLSRLYDYLQSSGRLHLLDNIPRPDEVHFVEQKSFPRAQPKKLLVGHERATGRNIFAYMRPHGDFHWIFFYTEDSLLSGLKYIRVKNVFKQAILHPFDKTFPEGSDIIDQVEKAHLTIIVKWYFISAGITKDCVLRELREFPVRLRLALEYINKRMTTATDLTPRPGSQLQTNSGIIPASTDIDDYCESIVSTTDTSFYSCWSINSRTVTPDTLATEEQSHAMSNQTEAEVIQSTKRKANDAGLDDLVEEITQADRVCSRDLERIDKEIGELKSLCAIISAKRKLLISKLERQTLAAA